MARSKNMRMSKNDVARTKYSSFIYMALVVMVVVLVYVWCHIQITEINYDMAKAVRIRESLIKENNELRMEIETLKSPGRIEEFARKKLNMQYPGSDQVVFVR